MERKLDRNRWIADYIYDDMKPEDVVEIEREISDDPQLSEAFRLNMQVKDYLKAKVQLEEMKSDPLLEDAEKLADMAFHIETDREHPNQLKPVGKKRRRVRSLSFVTAAAATVAIIIAIGILPVSNNQEKLFDRYYEPFEASDNIQRGELSEVYNEISSKGINYYMEGNFSQSINQFNKLTSDPAIRPEVYFFLGLSYMGLGKFQDAQINIEMIVDGNSRYQIDAIWYLCLCYLKVGEPEKAAALLDQLVAVDGMYKEDAQVLLKKLRRFR